MTHCQMISGRCNCLPTGLEVARQAVRYLGRLPLDCPLSSTLASKHDASISKPLWMNYAAEAD